MKQADAEALKDGGTYRMAEALAEAIRLGPALQRHIEMYGPRSQVHREWVEFKKRCGW